MESNSKIREIYFYKNHFLDFYDKLDKETKIKFKWTFNLIETINLIPSKYFEYIKASDGIFEIRIEFESNIYRVFSCFDKGKLIILFNGFQKKTKKTPKKEIDLALKLKKEYFDEKK